MTRITAASPEQLAKIDELREQAIADQTKPIEWQDAKSAIDNMWSRLGWDGPIVLQCDSPWQCCVVAVMLSRDQLYDQLGSQLHDQLSSQLRGQLRDQLRGQLRDQLYDQLYGQLDDQLYGQLDDQLGRQLSDQLRGQLSDQLYDQLYGQLDDQLYGQLYGQLDDQLGRQLSDQLRGQLRDQLRGQLRDQLYDQLYGQLDDQLYGQLDDQLGRQLSDQLYGQLDGQLRGSYYHSTWWRTWAAWYLGAEIFGAQFDRDLLSEFCAWCDACPFICGGRGMVCVSQNPAAIHWNNHRLHNDAGASVLYRDLWSVHSLQGLRVSQQLVYWPEAQTLDDINSEDNEELKRIRIERYGWERYLSESNAAVVDRRRNDMDATEEALMACGDLRVLVPTCKTGRLFAIEVPPDIETCEQAQHWLHSGSTLDELVSQTRVIGRT